MDSINSYIYKVFDESITIISKLGSIQLYIVLILAMYFLGEIEFSLLLTYGLIGITLIAIPIRLFLFKERPKREKFSNLLEKIKASSFPSMHSARFSFIIFSAFIYVKSQEFTLFLISIYVIVCYQRIHKKRHDIYDIVGGLILSTCIALFLFNL